MVYVAFLRGINVGGKNIIKMEALKLLCEKIGLHNIHTVLASGNLIFTSDILDKHTLALLIEKRIKEEFTITVTVLIHDKKSLEMLVKAIPAAWKNDTETKCDVMLLWKQIDNKSIIHDLPYKPDIENLIYTPGALIWKIDRNNIKKSRMLSIIGTDIYHKMTVRNPNTLRKIYTMIQGIK